MADRRDMRMGTQSPAAPGGANGVLADLLCRLEPGGSVTVEVRQLPAGERVASAYAGAERQVSTC